MADFNLKQCQQWTCTFGASTPLLKLYKTVVVVLGHLPEWMCGLAHIITSTKYKVWVLWVVMALATRQMTNDM